MAWMTVNAAVAITAGIIASSIALVAFGLDSVIEFAAATIVIWQLRGDGSQRETRAVQLIRVTFFALAAYLITESIRDLISQARPGTSIAALIVTAAALLIMPLLALAKQRTGQALGNQALIADAAESALCAMTSGAALLGIGLNTGLGWRWADPPPPLTPPPAQTTFIDRIADSTHRGQARVINQVTVATGNSGRQWAQVDHSQQPIDRTLTTPLVRGRCARA